MGTLIDRHTGLVNVRPKQGEKVKHYNTGKRTKEKNAKEIQICLNCDKPSCKGNCKKMREEGYGRI